MKIFFTTHILIDSSKRISDPKKRANMRNIKCFYRGLFKNLMTHDEYKGHKVKHFNKGYGVKKVVAGDHKFVYKKQMEDEFLLITYARKTDFDKQIGELIYLTQKIGKQK